jgi:uronate dehydrogenase
VIDTKMPPKPDGFYGLSKAFGEDLAEMYWARWGIETVSIRIGSALPAPKDRRMLSTWISFDDLERLVVSALTAPIVGHTIIFGMSDNQTSWWDNTHAKHLGYRALDSSDVFRSEVEARQPHIDRHDKAALYQGGAFVKVAPHGI